MTGILEAASGVISPWGISGVALAVIGVVLRAIIRNPAVPEDVSAIIKWVVALMFIVAIVAIIAGVGIELAPLLKGEDQNRAINLAAVGLSLISYKVDNEQLGGSFVFYLLSPSLALGIPTAEIQKKFVSGVRFHARYAFGSDDSMLYEQFYHECFVLSAGAPNLHDIVGHFNILKLVENPPSSDSYWLTEHGKEVAAHIAKDRSSHEASVDRLRESITRLCLSDGISPDGF